MGSNRLIKYSLASIATTIVAVAGGLTMAPTSAVELVIDHDGELITVETHAEEVEAALEEIGVDLAEKPLVEPKLSAKVKHNSAIKVRYYKPVSIINDGATVETLAPAATVAEALSYSDTAVAQDSYVSEALDNEVPRAGTEIVVSSMKTIELVVAGDRKTVESNQPTVGDLLEEQSVKLEEQDEISEELDSWTKPAMTVDVVDVQVEKRTVAIQQTLETQVKKDPTLLRGEKKVLEPGEAPVVERTLKIVYANGELRERKVVREKTVSRGAPRIVLRGTAKPEPVSTPPGGECGGWQPLLDKYFGGEAQKACSVMMCESRGNPTAQNPVSSASGIFQFIDGTWRSARMAVDGGAKYARAKDAPAELQIEAAAKWLERTSWSQWVCAGR